MPQAFVVALAAAIETAGFAPLLIFQAGVLINPEVVIALRSIRERWEKPPVIANVALMQDAWYVAFIELPTWMPWIGPMKPLDTGTITAPTQPPYTTGPNTTSPWIPLIKWQDRGQYYDPDSPYRTWSSGTASTSTFSGTASADGEPIPQ